VKSLGPTQTLEFRQKVAGADPWHFLSANMSDGTLRAFGVLVSLFQTNNGEAGIPLAGIDEPYPTAAGILPDSLIEAAGNRQVLVTSHSPDLLDSKKVETPPILAVHASSGKTQTAGELLRAGQLGPDPKYIEKIESRQNRLFDE
jgi:predicted ATPase